MSPPSSRVQKSKGKGKGKKGPTYLQRVRANFDQSDMDALRGGNASSFQGRLAAPTAAGAADTWTPSTGVFQTSPAEQFGGAVPMPAQLAQPFVAPSAAWQQPTLSWGDFGSLPDFDTTPMMGMMGTMDTMPTLDTMGTMGTMGTMPTMPTIPMDHLGSMADSGSVPYTGPMPMHHDMGSTLSLGAMTPSFMPAGFLDLLDSYNSASSDPSAASTVPSGTISPASAPEATSTATTTTTTPATDGAWAIDDLCQFFDFEAFAASEVPPVQQEIGPPPGSI